MASAVGGNVHDSIFPMHNQFCKLCEQHLVNPQVLACLHVVCEQCLMYLLYSAQGDLSDMDFSIVCPDCKKTVTIGLSGSGTSNMMVPQSIQTVTLFDCSNCVKETNSVFRCRYCSNLFCLSCFREHSYHSCSRIKGRKRIQKCAEHNMHIKYFCLKCQLPACIFCLINKHNSDDHKHIPIIDAENDVRNHMEKLLNDGKDQTNQCYGTISCLLEVLADLKSKHHTAKGELEATYQSFMKLCEKQYYDAARDLNKIYSEEEMKVKKLLHDIEGFGTQIGESCKMAKEVLMEADIVALLKCKTVIPGQFAESDIAPQGEVKALFKNATQAVDKTFQSTINDFHDKMILAYEGFEASFNTKASEDRKELTDDSSSPSTSKSVCVESHLPTKGSRVLMPGHPNYPKYQNNRTLTVKHKIGSFGILDGEFNNPSGFCLGANEEIIIADTFNHRIQIFYKNGTFKSKFGVAGKLEGSLWFPAKVADLGYSRLVICDQGVERSRLQMFTQDGIFLKKICFFDATVPSALTSTNEGNIIIMDKQVRFVYIINDLGELIRSFDCSNYIVEPSDIAVHDNEVYICDFKSHCVAVFTTAGVFRRYIGNKDVCCYPSGIHVTNEEVLVSDSNNSRLNISLFTRSGLFKAAYTCTQVKVSRCSGIKRNSDGDIFTVSRTHNNMLVMNNMFQKPN